MKKILFATCLFLTHNFGFGQHQIELHPHLRFDNYPSFDIAFNSVTNATITMKGKSWGVGLNYMFLLKNKLFIKGGAGYYKYSFDEIESVIPPFGEGPARSINYEPGPSSTFFYSCDKYWYNSISITVGLEKWFMLNKSTDAIAGLDIVNYYTLSQVYNIPATNYDTEYKTTNNRYFGVGFNISTGIQKEIGRLRIGPTFSLPIFSLWKQDSVFPFEKESKNRNKWLNGVQFGITCKYSLTKNTSK